MQFPGCGAGKDICQWFDYNYVHCEKKWCTTALSMGMKIALLLEKSLAATVYQLVSIHRW